MTESRRNLLMTLVGAAGVLAVKPYLFAYQGTPRPLPQPRPSPNAPNPNVPSGMDGPQATKPDTKPVKKQNQEELRSNVAKLSEMVADLKSQVDKLDSNSTLSLPIVKKAQEIEKLAKQIKDLAKG